MSDIEQFNKDVEGAEKAAPQARLPSTTSGSTGDPQHTGGGSGTHDLLEQLRPQLLPLIVHDLAQLSASTCGAANPTASEGCWMASLLTLAQQTNTHDVRENPCGCCNVCIEATESPLRSTM